MANRWITARCALAAGLVLSALAVASSAPLVVRGPYLQAPGGPANPAVVWYTDGATDGAVHWRPAGGFWQEARQTHAPGTRHEVPLAGLEGGAPHEYRVTALGTVLATNEPRADWSFIAAAPSPLRVVAFGDAGSGGPGQVDVAAAVGRLDPPPDFVLLLGDTVYPSGAEADYDRKFFAPYRDLLSRFPFLSVIGNHDYESQNGQPFLGVMSLPRNGPATVTAETVYSFDQGGVHFVAHDSNLGETQLQRQVSPWHVADVRKSNAPFKVAAMHHPAYSSGPNSVKAPTPAVRAFFGPLFSSTGIDLVLSGHEHAYERSRPVNGTIYVVSGAGGMDLYPRVASNDYSEIYYGEGGRFSYSTLDVEGRLLRLEQRDVAGCRVDTLALHKPLAEGDPWRVWRGAGAPPPDWASPGFADEAWALLPSAFGYGAPDLQAELGDMRGGYLTVHARAAFEAPGYARLADHVLLRLRYDDGFVAYLNGVEVARRNVPVGQVAATPAAGTHPGEWFETVALPASALVEGRNVLALEGHNRTLADASFVLAPELTLVAATPGRCP